MMRFRAIVKDEKTGDASWFVYVESPYNGPIYACRTGQRRTAERIAAAMNRAWESEGRLYVPSYDC